MRLMHSEAIGPWNLTTDWAPILRQRCEAYWKDAGGVENDNSLNLHLEPVNIDLDRIRLLNEAVQALLIGGLSPGFLPQHGGIGVHLWSLEQPEPNTILLIADSGEEMHGELSTPFITSARYNAEKAGCFLVQVPARGAVWRIHIPMIKSVPRCYDIDSTHGMGEPDQKLRLIL